MKGNDFYEDRRAQIERADDLAEAAEAGADEGEVEDGGRWALAALLPASADEESLHARAYVLGRSYAAILWPREPTEEQLGELAAAIVWEHLYELALPEARAFPDGGAERWRAVVRRAFINGFLSLFADREGTKVLTVRASGAVEETRG